MRRYIFLPLMFIYGSATVIWMNMTPLHIKSMAYRTALGVVAGSALCSAMLIMAANGRETLRVARFSERESKRRSRRSWLGRAVLCYAVAVALLALAQVVPAAIMGAAIGGCSGLAFGVGVECSTMARIEKKLRKEAGHGAD